MKTRKFLVTSLVILILVSTLAVSSAGADPGHHLAHRIHRRERRRRRQQRRKRSVAEQLRDLEHAAARSLLGEALALRRSHAPQRGAPVADPREDNRPATQRDAIDADAAGHSEPQTLAYSCSCCGGRMIIIDTFERGRTPAAVSIRIDTS